MSLLTVSDLSKSFGADDIFSGLSLSVPNQARIALVGANGIGKTTLLRILIGLDEPSSGGVHRARGLTIGYLPQEANLTAEHTLWQECLTVFKDLQAQEAELSRLEAAMTDPQRAELVMERYGTLQQDFEHRGGYTYETRIRQTLSGLGFDINDFHRPLWQLSGGQRTRALLARLLLSEPDLLVLDEPTNHLDIAAVEWLEGTLINWPGSVLLVSHDRYFLDKVVNNIWEMSRHGLETYRGNYSAYLQQRLERWEQRWQIYEAEMERLEKELDYIKRNIAGQRTQQAKGKLRRLSRQVEAIESLGFSEVMDKSWSQISAEADISTHTMGVAEVERRLRALKGPQDRPANLKINLKATRRSGEIVLRSKDLVIGYPGEPLFTAGDLELRRLECAAVIGPNGSGKTTFLKTILEQVLPLSGSLELGASLQVGYFAQAHEDLDPQRSLVEEIEAVAPSMLLANTRSYLARFLFSGEDVFRAVATLSGGERGRLALAKLCLMNANLLLLDEPTNHLDIPSQEVLQQVLSEFQGTMLLVSHDRYLIDALATQIWEIDEPARRLVVFKGSYSEYHTQQEAEKLLASERPRGPNQRDHRRQADRPSRAERRRKTRLGEIEAEIAALEARLAGISSQLESPPSNPDLVRDLGEDYVQIQNEIHALVVEWENLSSEDVED
ncbi:MAG: ABC-F family ATP-binding cassette domain-containing protein [Anaerolineales bacterium]|nr:ABC-F family ATP-binding cassette domain-containing protein [Anaerolineales bacterium]